MTRRLRSFTLLVPILIGACAVVPPFAEDELKAVDSSLTPEQAVGDTARGSRVLWGGTIVSTANLADHTDLSVLFYPLDASQRPDRRSPARNRFIVRYRGYLEPVVYTKGREITVLGDVRKPEDGKVGSAPQRFPVIEADRIHLWPLKEDSRVHFGVGVGVGFHM